MDQTPRHPRRHPTDFATQLQVVGARTLRSLQGFLALILSISIFGASLFGVLVSQLQPPGNGWSDSTVRTLMAVSWLLFVLALGVAAFSAVIIGPPFADDGVGPAALGGGAVGGGRGGDEDDEEEEEAPRFELVEPVIRTPEHDGHLHPHLRPDLHHRRPSSEEKPRPSQDGGAATATAAGAAQRPGSRQSRQSRRPSSQSHRPHLPGLASRAPEFQISRRHAIAAIVVNFSTEILVVCAFLFMSLAVVPYAGAVGWCGVGFSAAAGVVIVVIWINKLVRWERA
jgi:hypothetical protein